MDRYTDVVMPWIDGATLIKPATAQCRARGGESWYLWIVVDLIAIPFASRGLTHQRGHVVLLGLSIDG